MIKRLKIQIKIIITFIFALVLLASFSLFGFGGIVVAEASQEEQLYSSERIFKDAFFSGNELDNSDIIFGGGELDNNNSYDTTSERGGDSIEFWTERVNFNRRTQSGFAIADRTPHWLSDYHCGVTGGAVVFGFYNRRINNLIPNQTAGMYMSSRWMWSGRQEGARELQSRLFMLMGGGHGVTIHQYIWGMMMQAGLKGRSITLQSVRAGHNQLNEAAMTAAFRRGELVSLFMAGYSIVGFTGIETFADHDLIFHNISNGNHIMIAYGYRRIRYYNASNQLIRNDIYLYVKTGFSMGHALVPLYRIGEVSDAFITHIV
ncbi:MAG: hypothetical protein FWD82_00005 [Defluviitaleaceae bacterium]|nr:hypothetical protein [Defluviitaleaceae bacterium]